ncbi:hypothetical protein AAC387_Pa07g1484 [Persea americana]
MEPSFKIANEDSRKEMESKRKEGMEDVHGKWNLRKKRGDALVSYLKEPFVSLAIQLLDGTPLCPGGKIPMSVSIAKFEQKGDAFIAKQMDKKKKKKLKRVEDKILGWGMNFERRHMVIELPIKHRELFESLGIAQPKLRSLKKKIKNF